MKNVRNHFLLLLLIVFVSNIASGQYLRRQGKFIVDGNGNEIILRGMGLGGWMLQEGYMLETNSFANPQHQIRAKIVEVIGEANTNEFYERWLANHCTKRDIDSLAAWGFNSVRLPMHYNLYTLPIEQEPIAGQNTWLEKGFALTDSLVKWCAANELYLILDLHAAPGGQGKDAAISDYDPAKPSLWQSEANKQKTIALWRKLAERYATNPWIGGYDLINETNWAFTGANQNGCDETTNAPLKKLLQDITTAIREVDQNHMIILEGNCWANNYNGILPPWDNNLVVSFHKYWNNNDQGSIQGLLNIRDQSNIPLWLGESGENSNVWFTNAISLMEQNKIGWAWWPMKKVGSVVNPLTVVKNAGYQQLLNYWQNGGTKPSVETAKAALFELTENLKIENCIYRPDVIDAMFRQVKDKSTRPYRRHTLPGVINASDYDLGPFNRAYYDTDSATYHSSGGQYTAWNSGWSYRNDAVDIQQISDAVEGSNGHAIGWTRDKEWLQYTVMVDSSAAYNLSIRYSGATISNIRIYVDGSDKTGVVDLVASGGNNIYTNKAVNDVVLYKGTRKIKVYFEKGGANLSFLKFSLSKKLSDTPFKAIAAETSLNGNPLTITLNKKVDGETIGVNGFSVTVNNVSADIVSVAAKSESELLMIVDKEIGDQDQVRISYNGDQIKATDGTVLQAFTNILAANRSLFHHVVPGKIEAEAFSVNQGLQLETTNDIGGGQNIGYTNTNDFLEYLVNISAEGKYQVDLRVASLDKGGRVQLQQLSKEGQVLNTSVIEVPATGGWQTWKTVSGTMTLSSGRTKLKLIVLQPEFNLNWIEFRGGVINSTEENKQGSLRVFPNPTKDRLNIDLSEGQYRSNNVVTIRNLAGSVVSSRKYQQYDEIRSMYVGHLPAGMYVIEVLLDKRYMNAKFVVN